MPSVVLRNATDTYASGTAASTNYAAASVLHVRTADRYAYVFFNRAAPVGATITSAKLRLYHAAAWAGSRNIVVQRVSGPWQVSRLNWNNKPGVTGATVTVADDGGAAGTVVELNVTALLQTVSDGAAWYGFRISTNDATDRGIYSAQGLSQYRPTLEVAWTEAPEAPTTLAPSGNRAVSTNKPVLRFDFTDHLGDTTLAAVQVQIDPAGNFAAPAFDSGEVATANPELDLTTTAYAGLADLASTYWRVRVKDGSGLWSTWSEDEQFKRDDLGTVTIDNPAGATLSDPTPPFLWSFAGGVQKAWQVYVIDPADPSEILANSGKQTSSDAAWTPPPRTLVGAGPYRVVVRVWDTVDREKVPNGEVFAVATRDFTIVPDATVNPVVGLAVSQPNEAKPRMLLTWTRSEAPDRFVIVRDGVVVEDPLLPEDALVAGTSYQFLDDASRTWREHTWKVQAVVNGKASPSAVVTETTKTRGIWLLDKERSLEVWLAGQEGGSWAIGEEASVFAPVGGTNVVRRVQARRGYEGSLAGQLVDRYGKTAVQYEDDLMAMRAHPTRPVTLALADMSLRVILGNVTTYPLAKGVPPLRVASFDFWQVT